MEQDLKSMSYYSNDFEERLRMLNPFNRLIYMCLTASRMEDGTGEMSALSSDISDLIYELREKYSLNHYDEILKNQTSLINSNVELLTVSPLLMGPETWKEIIQYELSIIPVNDRDQEMRKMIGCIKDLSYRIDNDHIFNVFELMLVFDKVSHFSDQEGDSKDEIDHTDLSSHIELIESEEFLIKEILDGNGHAYMDSLDRGYYDIPLEIHINHLKNLDIRNLKTENPKYLLRRINFLESRQNEKIDIKKKPKPIIRGLTYLLSKFNPSKEKSYLSLFSAKVVHSIFDTPRTPNTDSFPDIKLEPCLLIDYLIFLIKYDYIENKNRPGIPMILSRQINFKLSGGQSYQTLNRLFNEKLPALDKNSNVKISFDGHTNEIALKNEMIY